MIVNVKKSKASTGIGDWGEGCQCLNRKQKR